MAKPKFPKEGTEAFNQFVQEDCQDMVHHMGELLKRLFAKNRTLGDEGRLIRKFMKGEEHFREDKQFMEHYDQCSQLTLMAIVSDKFGAESCSEDNLTPTMVAIVDQAIEQRGLQEKSWEIDQYELCEVIHYSSFLDQKDSEEVRQTKQDAAKTMTTIYFTIANHLADHTLEEGLENHKFDQRVFNLLCMKEELPALYEEKVTQDERELIEDFSQSCRTNMDGFLTALEAQLASGTYKYDKGLHKQQKHFYDRMKRVMAHEGTPESVKMNYFARNFMAHRRLFSRVGGGPLKSFFRQLLKLFVKIEPTNQADLIQKTKEFDTLLKNSTKAENKQTDPPEVENRLQSENDNTFRR